MKFELFLFKRSKERFRHSIIKWIAYIGKRLVYIKIKK